jgi:hypothetical protein
MLEPIRERERSMHSKLGVLALGLIVAMAAPASAQVVGGVLFVNNTHMS